MPSQAYSQREYDLLSFQATETCCTPPVHSKCCTALWLILPMSRLEKGKGWFQEKLCIGASVLWAQYLLKGGSSQTLVFWHSWDCHQVLISVACYVLLFCICKKKAFSWQVKLRHDGEHVWSAFQVREPSCKQTVHRKHCTVAHLP